MATGDCSRCAEVKRRATKDVTVFLLKEDLEAYLKKETSEFLKYASAYMNTEDGGTLFLHANTPQLLDSFDQKVDDKLRELIPDNRQFSEHFERSFFEDKHHVMIRIKPRAPQSMISTFQFHTKTSMNKGLGDQRHSEMFQLIQKIIEEELPGSRSSHNSIELVNLKQGHEVEVNLDGVPTILQESTQLQAKDVDRDKNTDLTFPYLKVKQNEQNDPEDGPEHHATSLDEDNAQKDTRKQEEDPQNLREFICAFASVPRGGRWYSGVEQRHVTKKHTALNPAQEQNKPSTSKKIKNPRMQEFLAQGYEISFTDRKLFEKNVKDRIVKNLLWVGHQAPVNPVEVHFHDVEGGQDLCVVEVNVKYFHGLCFKYRCGPEAYHVPVVQPHQEQRYETYAVEDWLSIVSKHDALQNEFFRMQVRIEHLENQIPMVDVEMAEGNEKATTTWHRDAARLQRQWIEIQTELAGFQDKLARLQKKVPAPEVDEGMPQEPKLKLQVPIFQEPMDTS